MGLFDDMLKEEESLFIDTLPLDVDFMPGVVKHREHEQQYIATCIKPLFQKRSGKNLFITGSPGIGKTVAVKHVLQELKKETEGIETIYVNCWKKDTAHKIALEICEQLDFKFTHNKDTTDLFRDIAKLLNKKAAVIVLDEVDKVAGDELFYTLMEDIYRKTLLLITNEGDWLAKIDNRVRSRLMLDVLEFRRYSPEEVLDILRERAEYAFVKGVLASDALALIAQKTFEAGDIRVGLFLLKEAGDYAEQRASRKIALDHVKKIVDRVKEFRIKSLDTLDPVERKVLEFANLHSGKTAKHIFDLFSKEVEMSYSTFHRRLKQLEKGRFLTLKEANTGTPGKTTVVEKGNTKLYEFQ